MSDASNDLANDLANVPLEIARPGHWYKGMPKIGGRQKGAPNKVGPTAQELARKHTRSAIRALWKLALHGEQEATRLKSLELLLAYASGRPAQVQLIGGSGQPIQSQHLTVEISRRISEVFGQVATGDQDKPVGEVLDDQSLRAVSAVSFLAAQAEANQLPASSPPASGSRGEATEVRMPPGPGRAGDASPRGSEAGSVKTPIVDVAPEPEPPDPGFTLSFVEHDYTIRGVEPSRANLPVTFELRRRGGLCRSGPFALCLDLMREQVGPDLGPFVVQPPQVSGEYSGPDQGPTMAPLSRP